MALLKDPRHSSLRVARDLVNSLRQADLKPPKRALDALQRADKLAENRPPAGGARIADILLNDGHAAALSAAQERAVADKLEYAYEEAGEVLGKQTVAAIRADADRITAELRPRAVERITKLETLAAETRNLNQLVRAGETELAQTLAEVDVTAAELNELYALRNKMYGRKQKWGGEGTVFESSTWMNYHVVDGNLSFSMTPSERYLAGLRAGGELWYPTPEESKENAADLESEFQELSMHERSRTRFNDQAQNNALKLMRASNTERVARLQDRLVRAAPRGR